VEIAAPKIAIRRWANRLAFFYVPNSRGAPVVTQSASWLLAKDVVGPCDKRHQIRRGDEAGIFSINVGLGDRTGQRASRSYVEGDFVPYGFGNCLG
jgi:hypothetical protein